MKKIKSGKVEPIVTEVLHTCTFCEGQFSYNSDDIKLVHLQKADGDVLVKKVVQCPFCKVDITLGQNLFVMYL